MSNLRRDLAMHLGYEVKQEPNDEGELVFTSYQHGTRVDGGYGNADHCWEHIENYYVDKYETSVDAALALPLRDGAFWSIDYTPGKTCDVAILDQRETDGAHTVHGWATCKDGKLAETICEAWLKYREANNA